jgi:ribonuclease III
MMVSASEAEGLSPATDAKQGLLTHLGYVFSDPGLFEQALTHRSYVNENSGPHIQDNERLEFLGDAIIDFVVTEELFARFPDAREGRLSKLRAALVSEAGLAPIARGLGVGSALRLGRGEELSGGREKPSLLADAFEALMAAVFLDGGVQSARSVLLRILSFPEDGTIASDAKTTLQQQMQASHQTAPTYALVEVSGPEHERTFEVEVCVDGTPIGRGSGRNKKEAEQAAAAAALDKDSTTPT